MVNGSAANKGILLIFDPTYNIGKNQSKQQKDIRGHFIYFSLT
jgi:hypothetical protein